MLTVLLICNISAINGLSNNLDSNLKTTIKPIFQLDAHRSFFLNQWVKVNGIRLGVNLDDCYKLGLAFYNSDFVRLEDQVIESDTFLVKIKYVSSAAFIEYDIIDIYKWNWSLYSSLGSGRGALEFKRTDNLLDSSATINRIPQLNLGSSVEYKLWPFLGAGVGVGYRRLRPNSAILSEIRTANAFNSPYYSFKVKLHFGELYKYIFNREKYDEERKLYLESKKHE